ncbi:MAG: hypothetical protein ACRDY3_03315 [Acidimicrobiales bacterium]
MIGEATGADLRFEVVPLTLSCSPIIHAGVADDGDLSRHRQRTGIAGGGPMAAGRS